MKHTPILMTDFYKVIHHFCYVPDMEYLTSYWTPRKTRIENVDKVVMFGLQAWIKEFLIDTFERDFFSRPYTEIHEEYVRIIKNTMNEQAADDTVMRQLHELGYLPLEIKAVDEGTKIPISCPMIQFRNTVPGFGWLVNFLETPASCGIWHAMTAATIGDKYKRIVKKHFEKAVDNDVIPENACGDFSMRGMTSRDSAYAASAGHLLSFYGTATIGAIMWLEDYYNCDCEKEIVGKGTPSTEHSVMESYGKENEFECYRHLIEDVFPKGPLSMVSDTWDYWNVLTNYLPALKKSIMKRDGKIIIRGDSGDPVDIICGEKGPKDYMEVDGLTPNDIKDYFKNYAEEQYGYDGSGESNFKVRIGDFIYHVVCEHEWVTDEDDNSCSDGYYDANVIDVYVHDKYLLTPADKGTVELLWETFGGTINSKGYKVLDGHVGAIYGDSITPERAEAIYSRLEEKGFAPNNCTLGIGSYTYQYVTRDSLGFALKATHCVVNGENKIIFKDPITDKSKGNNFKKSQKGMCYVYRDENGNVKFTERLHPEDFDRPEYKDNMLTTVFLDGRLIKDDSLKTIRERLNAENA